MANEKISDVDLRRLCDEIAERDGVVRINVLREAAGGGSYARLARVVDEWGAERGRAKPRPLRLGKHRPESAAPQNTTPQNTRPQNTRPQNTRPQNTTPQNTASQKAETGIGAAAAMLREENEMLWRMLREEREARLAEIDRLNRLLDLMSRHAQAGGFEHQG
ncbi:hypothetical protein [Arenibaculum pallidiluteum]|uniref:hypothetical protein n=1 Tax=Arenibaculum pallidiluteum TaxID=2812559 RepID=UPI001A9619B4|nr:hypothetical protein [Arenibaculum pallidiluteum]